MKQLSPSTVFLNTNASDQKIGLLKPLQCLEARDDDENIFQKSLLDRYIHRPAQFEDVSYAEFGANYTVIYSEKNQDDSLSSVMNDADAVSPQKIKLTDNFGAMHKRNHEAIIRFHKPNKEKTFFQTKLMLYLPWRDETSDILGGYPDYYSHY